MSRPLIATVDLDALRHNYRLARSLHGRQALAVIKANAYGHNAVRCAQALAGEADGFAVACIEEAVSLREAGITRPILLLEGCFEAAELELVDRLGLWTVVHQPEQIAMIEAATLSAPLTVWLKLDSGMHRVGFHPEDYRAAWQRLTASGKVGKIVKMSHFARADEIDPAGREATRLQVASFEAATQDIPGETSRCNSAAILGVPAAHGDWGRAGLMLYGVSPFDVRMPEAERLRPVMSLESRVIAVRELPPGEPVGYGARFVTDKPTRVGVVACGYADGYPRLARTGTPVRIDGKRSRLIGRVSMDMLTVDLSDLPQAGIGSAVELWGREVSVADVAAGAGTIAYELLCNVKRAHFRWIDA